jgi:hypothetical protein
MKFKDLETTFVCQLGKPQNRKILEDYRNRRDSSGKELAKYYIDIFNMLIDTPAFGVSGVNKMLNELTSKVRATLNKERRGKTTAWAHAGQMLSQIDYFSKLEARPSGYHRVKLAPRITAEELERLISCN